MAAGCLSAQQLPAFVVPGHQRQMQTMGELFQLHHSPRTSCTLWDGWLPMSTLWPAIGPDGKESAQGIRDFYRHALTTRHINEEGYVAMNQHRGLAHPDGWPFPTWQQAGGVGWHFTHQGDSYARMLNTPLADLTDWKTEGIVDPKVDRDKGLVFRTDGPVSSLTTPRFEFDADVSPFIVVEWSADQHDPYLEWTTDQRAEFSEDRRVPIRIDPDLGAQYRGGLQLSAVPMYRNPKWNGKITRLRIGWANDESTEMTVRSLHTAIDSRHPITGALFVRGCVDYFNWTGDLDFLRSNIDRMRTAIAYMIREFQVSRYGCVRVPWVGHDGRAGFDIGPRGEKKIYHGRGVGNNYWDLMPFGHNDFLATLYLYDALGGLAALEESIRSNPQWNVTDVPSEATAAKLRATAESLRSRGQELFWNDATGRFVACIDVAGESHDYGFTFLNLEAVHYGFASDSQAESILDWVDGKRIIENDTSQGEDIYHWRFAPRATTRRNVEWYGWYWHGPETIPWGGQVQDGGAVLGFSFHDLMARIKTTGSDDAWKRLQEILKWFGEVQEEGGYRKYYAKPQRGSLQGGGTPGGLGLDHEFLESVLIPQVMLYGFMGFEPTPTGVQLNPKLPSDWPELTITRIHYRDLVFDLRVTSELVEVVFRRKGNRELKLRLPDSDTRIINYRGPKRFP